MALPGHYVMALPGHYVMALPCHYYGLATMLRPCLSLCYGPRGNKSFETNISIIESTDKGFPEILSWIIIGLGQNALRSEAFDKFQA